MNLNRRGQSILEYSFIGALVILGVVIMGPYVLRSINAHFKIWDDQIQDSHSDRFINAQLDQIRDLPTGCVETGEAMIGCGPIRSNTTFCPEGQKMFESTFDPPGCSYKARCVVDSNCCSMERRGTFCGTVPLPDPNFRRTGTNLPLVNGQCYYGERPVSKLCGAQDLLYCIPDTTDTDGDENCLPQCQGEIPNDTQGRLTASFCPGSTNNLLRNETISYVDSCPDPNNQSVPSCILSCQTVPYVQSGNNINVSYILNTERNSCISCGNGTCDTVINETPANCPADCMAECEERELASFEQAANVVAGGFKEYTSPLFAQGATFTIDVWTEDLIFEITFYDAQNNILLTERCDNSGPGNNLYSGTFSNSSKCGHDGADGINHYIVSAKANKMYVKVTEGGTASSDELGYSVKVETDCPETCEPEYFKIKKFAEAQTAIVDCQRGCGNLIQNVNNIRYVDTCDDQNATLINNLNNLPPRSTYVGTLGEHLYCTKKDGLDWNAYNVYDLYKTSCDESCGVSDWINVDTIGSITTDTRVAPGSIASGYAYYNESSLNGNERGTPNKICQLLGYEKASEIGNPALFTGRTFFESFDNNAVILWNPRANRWEKQHGTGLKYYWTGTEQDWKTRNDWNPASSNKWILIQDGSAFPVYDPGAKYMFQLKCEGCAPQTPDTPPIACGGRITIRIPGHQPFEIDVIDTATASNPCLNVTYNNSPGTNAANEAIQYLERCFNPKGYTTTIAWDTPTVPGGSGTYTCSSTNTTQCQLIRSGRTECGNPFLYSGALYNRPPALHCPEGYKPVAGQCPAGSTETQGDGLMGCQGPGAVNQDSVSCFYMCEPNSCSNTTTYSGIESGITGCIPAQTSDLTRDGSYQCDAVTECPLNLSRPHYCYNFNGQRIKCTFRANTSCQ